MNLRTLAVLVPVAVLIATCSSPASAPASNPSAGPAASAAVASPDVAVTGEIQITMTDAMRFEPGAMTVKRGEPITFVVKNAGVIDHEIFVGTEAEQIEHAAHMAKADSAHGHSSALRVGPGQTGSLTVTFALAGSQMIGCHEPGHYEAGMSAPLTVVD